MNFSTFNTFCPQKSYDTSLFFFGSNWKTRWHVYRSIATHTLRMGNSHSQGQTIRIWCTMLPTLSSLTLTNTLQTKKCRNFLKYLRIMFVLYGFTGMEIDDELIIINSQEISWLNSLFFAFRSKCHQLPNYIFNRSWFCYKHMLHVYSFRKW